MVKNSSSNWVFLTFRSCNPVFVCKRLWSRFLNNKAKQKVEIRNKSAINKVRLVNAPFTCRRKSTILDSRNSLPAPSRRSASMPRWKWEPMMSESTPIWTNTSGRRVSGARPFLYVPAGWTTMKIHLTNCTHWSPIGLQTENVEWNDE